MTSTTWPRKAWRLMGSPAEVRPANVGASGAGWRRATAGDRAAEPNVAAVAPHTGNSPVMASAPIKVQ